MTINGNRSRVIFFNYTFPLEVLREWRNIKSKMRKGRKGSILMRMECSYSRFPLPTQPDTDGIQREAKKNRLVSTYSREGRHKLCSHR